MAQSAYTAPAMTRPEDVPNEALEIGLCGPEDRAEQARLFNACFKKTLEAEELVWRYDENPHGAAVSLVSRPPGGEGVCGYACSPRLAVPDGNEAQMAPIGQTGDVMTHPDWRKRGIFSGLDARCMEETAKLGWPVVFGLPNRRSAHIFLKLGWEQVGTIRPWTLVLESSADARALRIGDGRLKALMVPFAVRAWKRAHKQLRIQAAGRYDVRGISEFPPQTEALSREVEAGFGLMVRRDADYLNWRFVRNTRGLHRCLGAFDSEGTFLGYVVVQVPRPGSRLGYLVDLLAAHDGVRAALLEAGIAQLLAAGAAAVQATAIDGSAWSDTLQATGFQTPREENHLIVILYTHDPEHPLAKAARDTTRWYLTDGDRDDETMG